ncbi:Protein shank [Clonorchis sinensis]|uniref:Protein shank n=2 Tax=Clonorchis sinensis TaxID=79923 RepID=A0A8T1M6B8_CLOSI|nr:Protein shank [Clonorchis sinensis]
MGLMDKFSKDVQKSFIRYVTRGDHKKVSSILAKGFDPNFHCQKTGETPLTIAVTRNKPQAMITALVAGGAHRDYFSKFGLTPLHKAAAVGNYEAVKTLLDFGQSPNTIDKAGLTPLYYNILNDQDTKICHSLLYEHSQLGICDAEGLQEIHQAARLNRVEQINLLIMYGADVNSRCVPPNGTIACLPPNKFCPMATTNDTPLHVAAAAGQRNAVMRLLSWGADPTLINVSNQTAIQVAQSCDHMELADAIRFFRGDVHHSLYGGPFLPTPTYNPKRRMRKAPQSSYISEPTMLVPIATRPKESGPRTAYSSLPTPVEESNISRPSRINGHSTNMSSTMQRAMSMYNLAENGQKTGAQFPFQQNSTSISPTAVCGSFFMASQIYYDSRVMDSTASVSATLSRRPKLAARKTDELSGLNSIVSHKPRELQKPYVLKQPEFTTLVAEGPRHFSRLDRPELLTSFVSPGAPCGIRESNWGREFQREGSQTDSGISNSSSAEKTVQLNALRSSPQGKPLNGRSPPVAYDFRMHRAVQPISTSASRSQSVSQPQGMKPSVSCFDYREWHLKAGRPSVPLPTFGQLTTPPLVPRTVVLWRSSSEKEDENGARSSFGLSLRTAKDPEMIATFQPTASRPSLQTATRIVPNMPAHKAGIREGDFILKINGIDISRASHDEVIQCLSGAVLDSVCLTIVSPVIQHPSAPKPPPLQPQVSADRITPAAVMNKSDPISDQSASTSTSSATYYSIPVDDHSKGYQVPPQSTKSGRPALSTESSELSSARSSDRTNCSSIQDEGVWSQSTGTSSNNISARSSLVTRPQTLNINTEPADAPPAVRQYSGSKLDVQINALPQPPRVVGLTRSRTTSGLDEVNSTAAESTSLAQSLYFARHPRFRRIGSHDSQSSTSSVGVPASAPQTKKIPVRSRSGVHTEPRGLKNMNFPQKPEKPCNGSPGGAKITVIRADREASRQRIPSAETINSNNIRRYPALQQRSPPSNEQTNPELVLLPPPAQFR